MDVKRKKLFFLYFHLSMGIVFSSIVIAIFLVAVKRGVDFGDLIPVAALILLMLNGTIAFGYYNSVKFLIKADSQGELRKSTNDYWPLIASLILLIITTFCFVLIFFKKMVLIGAVVLIISGVVFLFFIKKRLQKRG